MVKIMIRKAKDRCRDRKNMEDRNKPLVKEALKVILTKKTYLKGL